MENGLSLPIVPYSDLNTLINYVMMACLLSTAWSRKNLPGLEKAKTRLV